MADEPLVPITIVFLNGERASYYATRAVAERIAADFANGSNPSLHDVQDSDGQQRVFIFRSHEVLYIG
jgi:hypothetical protein